MVNKENEKIKKINTCRTILNVPIDMDNKFREMALKRGISKSQMILFSMGWYIDYNTSIDMMPKLFEALKSAEKLNISDSYDNN